jgi:hypothetical protein
MLLRLKLVAFLALCKGSCSHEAADIHDSKGCLPKCLRLCADFDGDFVRVLRQLPVDFKAPETEVDMSGQEKSVFEQEFAPKNRRLEQSKRAVNSRRALNKNKS